MKTEGFAARPRAQAREKFGSRLRLGLVTRARNSFCGSSTVRQYLLHHSQPPLNPRRDQKISILPATFEMPIYQHLQRLISPSSQGEPCGPREWAGQAAAEKILEHSIINQLSDFFHPPCHLCPIINRSAFPSLMEIMLHIFSSSSSASLYAILCLASTLEASSVAAANAHTTHFFRDEKIFAREKSSSETGRH